MSSGPQKSPLPPCPHPRCPGQRHTWLPSGHSAVQASPGLSNSCGSVAQHAHSALYFGQVSTHTHSGRLLINVNFEASGALVHKLGGTPGLDGGNSTDMFGNHVT